MTGHPHTHPAAHSFRHLRRNSPDSDHDASHISPVPFSVHPGSDFDMTPDTGHYISERVRLQSRRTFTLSYQNSGAQDFRDRSHSRTHRNLVVVFPPPDFPVQHGQLGNVLSTGPRHRLSQGILMPLFPSVSTFAVWCVGFRPNNSLFSRCLVNCMLLLVNTTFQAPSDSAFTFMSAGVG